MNAFILHTCGNATLGALPTVVCMLRRSKLYLPGCSSRCSCRVLGTAKPRTVLGFTSGLSGSAPCTVGWSYGRSIKSQNIRRIGKSFISILKARKHCQGFQKYWKVSFKSKHLLFYKSIIIKY